MATDTSERPFCVPAVSIRTDRSLLAFVNICSSRDSETVTHLKRTITHQMAQRPSLNKTAKHSISSQYYLTCLYLLIQTVNVMHKIIRNCSLCVFLERTAFNILSCNVSLSLNAQSGTHRLPNKYTRCLRAAFVSVVTGRGNKSATPVSQQNPQNTFQ